MADCNTLKPGGFLMFSQYTEDLTREMAHSEFYRVIPSKFIAANMTSIESVNEALKNFEVGCKTCRNQMNDSWTPNNSTNLFWDELFEKNILQTESKSIKTENSETTINAITEFKYVGDINMQSYNEYLGSGYSEIYCYIPADSKTYFYDCAKPVDKKDKIDGFYPNSYYNINLENNTLDSQINYTINSIIVLYDVVSRSDNGKDTILYENVPLGIYWLENSMEIDITNDDIYGGGTAYGVNICTRMTPCTNESQITFKTEGNLDKFSLLLSEISINQNKIDEILKSFQNHMIDMKEFLSMFKNSRVNVPYIINVRENEPHWFVNGRDLGKAYYDNLQK